MYLFIHQPFSHGMSQIADNNNLSLYKAYYSVCRPLSYCPTSCQSTLSHSDYSVNTSSDPVTCGSVSQHQKNIQWLQQQTKKTPKNVITTNHSRIHQSAETWTKPCKKMEQKHKISSRGAIISELIFFCKQINKIHPSQTCFNKNNDPKCLGVWVPINICGRWKLDVWGELNGRKWLSIFSQG